MLAASAAATSGTLALPGVSPDLAVAFANTTCTGCHTSEPTVDGAFHISPLRRGKGALSGAPGGRPCSEAGHRCRPGCRPWMNVRYSHGECVASAFCGRRMLY